MAGRAVAGQVDEQVPVPGPQGQHRGEVGRGVAARPAPVQDEGDRPVRGSAPCVRDVGDRH
ncbi:hypothetical protein BJF78_01040 [Pseudonocardia sp. CNS-139]|nr:hypothetical protein BJF78_01040 [Pseudonocardia sp. CNS-139]